MPASERGSVHSRPQAGAGAGPPITSQRLSATPQGTDSRWPKSPSPPSPRPPLPMGSPWVPTGGWRLGPTIGPPMCVRRRLGPRRTCPLCWGWNTTPCTLTAAPQHYPGEGCTSGCRRNGGGKREEQGPGWRWGMKTSPCPQRKSLAAGDCPALADDLSQRGPGCGQEATPASHLPLSRLSP